MPSALKCRILCVCFCGTFSWLSPSAERQMRQHFYGAPSTRTPAATEPAWILQLFSHTRDNCSHRSGRSDTKTVAMQLGAGRNLFFLLMPCASVSRNAGAARKDPRIILISFVLHCANFSGGAHHRHCFGHYAYDYRRGRAKPQAES